LEYAQQTNANQATKAAPPAHGNPSIHVIEIRIVAATANA